MTVLKILTYPNPLLKKKAEPVQVLTPEIITLISDMAETMFDAGGVGLAAPQVGVSIRLFVLAFGERHSAFINPEICVVEGEKVKENEGCLSFPGAFSPIERPTFISVRYWNKNWESVLRSMEGQNAVAFQHELDHLDGILMPDRMRPLARTLFLKQASKKRR